MTTPMVTVAGTGWRAAGRQAWAIKRLGTGSHGNKDGELGRVYTAREKWRKDNLKALNAQLRNGEEDQKVFDGGWHSNSGLSHSSSRHRGAENTSLRPPLTSAVLFPPPPQDPLAECKAWSGREGSIDRVSGFY